MASILSDYSIDNDIFCWRHKGLCPVNEFNIMMNSIDSDTKDERIIRVDINADRFIMRTMLKGLVVLKISKTKKEFNKLINEANIKKDERSLLERLCDKCSEEDFEMFFSEDKSFEDYYHFCVAKGCGLNANVIKEICNTFSDQQKVNLIIEATILIKEGIIELSSVNDCLASINKKDAFEICKMILEKSDVEFKKNSRIGPSIKIEYKVNMEGNYKYPMFKAVYDLYRLKKSKAIKEFEDIIESDLNLKFLKIMHLFDASKSVKMVVSCFNTMLDELGIENNVDYSDLKIGEIKNARYSNSFKVAVKSMKEMITRLKEKEDKSEVIVLSSLIKDKIQ